MSLEQPSGRAIVLVNLGTPERADAASVRAFLKDFLSDRRVVEIPRPLWWVILNGFILTTRPKKVAEAYRSIWTEQGSPLRAISEQQTQKLQEYCDEHSGLQGTQVRLAMSYGKPGLVDTVEQLRAEGFERIAVLPLYPQYSATTTAVVYDQLAKHQARSRDIADTRVCKSYYQRSAYIEALADSVRRFRTEHGEAKRLLMSFHGIPQRCVDLGDPYFDHCMSTAERLAAALGLTSEQWGISFQSRLGRAQWLQPYTIQLVKEWGEESLESVDVICPAFASDCLETLEEIAVEIKEEFQSSGGGDFRYIPCLNADKSHIAMLGDISEELLALT